MAGGPNPARDSCSVRLADNCLISRSNYTFAARCQTDRDQTEGIKSIPRGGERGRLWSGAGLIINPVSHVGPGITDAAFQKRGGFGAQLFITFLLQMGQLVGNGLGAKKKRNLKRGPLFGTPRGNSGAQSCYLSPPVALLSGSEYQEESYLKPKGISSM